jgi:predicted GTPase
MKKIRAIIMGAAGRDFHNFNVYFLPRPAYRTGRRQAGRKNPNYKIVAFTANQIPGIENRKYLGIPIYPEGWLPDLIKKYEVEEVFFAYSDISYQELMNKAAIIMAAGASFCLLGPEETMLKSKKPIIAVTAVRTGCGKSPVSQKIADYFRKERIKAIVVRHPMAYGNLKKQICQRFASFADLKKHNCTIEEREEYEPYIEKGMIVYAGIDYQKILKGAEKEAEIILWDGGNNDLPFFKPDLHITVLDALRPGHEISYYPGEINFRMADLLIINKVNDAPTESLEIIKDNIRCFNPAAKVILAKSKISVDKPELIRNKRVLVVEDGPTMTHGGASFGAGYLASKKHRAKKIIDPRPFAVGSLKEIFKKYSHLKNVLPAMGYNKRQIKELEKTINRTACDSVVVGTPIDLCRLLKINKPSVRVRYSFEEIKKSKLENFLDTFLRKHHFQ